MISSSNAIITRLLPTGKQGGAFGLFTASSGLGITVGAPLGGAISGWLSWHGIFFFDVCIGLFGVVVAWKGLPRDRFHRGNSHLPRFDVSGAILSFLAIFFMLFALNRVCQRGWNSPAILFSLLISGIPGILFILREKWSTDPLVDPKLLQNRNLLWGLLVGVLVCAVFSGNALLMPFYLEMLKGMTPQLAGATFLLYAISVTLTSPIAGRLADTISPRLLISVSLAVGVCVCLLFSIILGRPGNVPLLVFMPLFGLAIGMFLAPNNSVIMTYAPETSKGTFSSFFNMFNNFGMALGACLFEAIFSHCVSHGQAGPVEGTVPQELLLTGFHRAYDLAAFMFLVGLILSVILLVRKA